MEYFSKSQVTAMLQAQREEDMEALNECIANGEQPPGIFTRQPFLPVASLEFQELYVLVSGNRVKINVD